MPFVSITRLRVRSWRFLPVFLLATFRSARQARDADGNLAVKLLRDKHNTFWTSTCWDSEDSMKVFIRENPHGTAMRKLLEWCDEASLVHWTQESTELPAWADAHRRMLREGRASKVNHPSDAQKAQRIDAPDASAKREVRLK
jgi:heme-degrading monooxygenase HmoA